ncbi:MAG: acetylornithine/succinylornithine family transaminase [Vicinamibacterales bacterium]|jgi:acetylornithine/LysW-gamma-L-lysine aminotransferase|nr:acetylornithine/succinylornithine family transaminase [Vicinamibacterales bacterium]MDP7690849.1 acetylornithine/succinylornithine family transaminase [Vicinamibacterales bacterium]HJN42718.1 acetylornithine/succinylornithine family transaminase [Vicinamibacterales bacterium]
MSTRTTEQTYALDLFPRRDVTIVRGEGATLWDDTGRAYIDCVAGFGVASVGHANLDVADAVAAQARTLVTCPSIYYNDVRARLLEKLVAITPAGLNRAFLCNSGTESVEAALKFARHVTGRTDFVCAMRGFHGRTLGALSATSKYRSKFEPLVPGFSFVPFDKSEKLHEQVTEQTAAVMLELVQGEGGVRMASRDYLDAARAACDATGALLIVDEVQTGFCRTGKMFATDHYDARPDLLCVAKAIAGGIPMGAVVCSDKIQDVHGIHGTTFGGNPLAAAAALAAIEFMERHDLANQAKRKGEHLRAALEPRLPAVVRELRQIGLMVGIELKDKAQPYLAKLMEHGVFALPAGPTVVRLLPPLVITDEQLDTVADALIAVLGGS